MDKVLEKATIKRTDRELENRESKVKEWKPASSLPEFDQKAGWSYRWVRSALLNEPDNMNVSAKMREGWEPVKHSEHPEIHLAADPNSQYKDGVEIGGVLLCKIPTMNQNDPRMPKFAEGQETGASKFGKGNK
jgi:hypothetical protein